MADDYFSDRFIQDESSASQPRRTPEQANPRRRLSSLMEESRVKQVSIPLQQSNKGFQLLSKLGYQGGGLGKSSQGTKEPIDVISSDVKNDAGGLGINEAKKRRLEEKKDEKREQTRLQQSLMVDFKENQIRKSIESKSSSILKSCLRIISELDSRSGCTPFCDDIEASIHVDSSGPNLDEAIEVCLKP